MSWRIDDPAGCLDRWGAGKNHDERYLLLDGLADMADSPMTTLPGARVARHSPMNRWTIIGGTVVVFRVYEPQGHIDILNIYDLSAPTRLP